MRRFYPGFFGGLPGVGLLILRLVAGTAFILHGWPKMQNPTGWMNAMGSSMPAFLQAIAAFTEFGGGIALILGLLTPLVALALLIEMVVALLIVHIPAGHPFVAAQPNGPSFETALLYLAVAFGFIALGPGMVSIDSLLFRAGQPAVRLNERTSIRAQSA